MAGAPSDLQIETSRRLTTLSGEHPAVVWDARVVDSRGKVLSSCDHGHDTVQAAVECGQRQRERLIG